jgi:hypothetical protein
LVPLEIALRKTEGPHCNYQDPENAPFCIHAKQNVPVPWETES